MPLTVECADKYSIIRSMTHDNNGHKTANLPQGVTEERLQQRRSILETIDAFSKGMEKHRQKDLGCQQRPPSGMVRS